MKNPLGQASVLGVTTALFGLWARQAYSGSWLEYWGFVTGIVGIFLVSRESIWNWPIGIINCSIYFVFFFQGGFPADAGLQVFFLVLSLQGWYSWLRGGEQKTNLTISRLTSKSWLVVLVAWVVGTAACYPLAKELEGKWPFWDSFLTIGSIVAQVLVNRKKLENWFLWILVNTCYVPIFVMRGWYMSAILYAIFWVLALMGLFGWRKTAQVH